MRKLTLTNKPAIICQFIFLLTGLLLHLPLMAQLNQKVKLPFEEASVKQTLNELAQLTRYKFSYNNEDIDLNRRVVLRRDSQPVMQILDDMGKQASFSYVQKDETIIIIPQHPKKQHANYLYEKVQVADITVTGKVTDNTGKPLAGVTIAEKGTNNAVTTDANGSYSIVVKEASVLVFSYSGMVKQEVTVKNQTVFNISLEPEFKISDEVVVVGSRLNIKRTKVETPLPVDVLSANDLQNTGQIEVGQMLQFVSPSFNSAKTGINGAANYADPATLRGLSPDQMLVLVNGKRRHQFSALNLNVTIGKGTVVTDMNTIPSLALERVEVLRDGAAAQYGSDAIAGIANLVLKKSTGQGMAKLQYGRTGEGDGGTFLAAVNYGFKLGKPKSYLNFTLHYQDVKFTDRSDPFSGNIYIANSTTNPALSNQREDSARNARGIYPTKTSNTPFKVTKYGSNGSQAYQGFVNFGYPLNDRWSVYLFGGASKKDIKAFGFFRNAIPTDQNSNPAVAPDGYSPELPGTTIDYSVSGGFKREVKDGWNIDISSTYGYNSLDQNANNTTNPSMGSSSPRNFYVGQSAFGQSTNEVLLSKNFGKRMNLKSFNLAMGAQVRIDNYKLKAGDPNSYFAGPLAFTATNKKAPGSSGRPGISPADAIDTSRINIGVFADVETDLTKNFLVAFALRYENYSDFGGNLSGKLALRYKLKEWLSARVSVNRGFRAPSLQQIYNSVTTSTVQAGAISQTKQLRSSDPRLSSIGVEKPTAETSWSYSAGLTASAASSRFLFTADVYRIDISNRIIITENLVVNNIAALQTIFSDLQEISFFTNNINTKTQGLELVTSYRQTSTGHGFNASAALSLNKTIITSSDPAPSQLQAGTTTTVKLIDTISVALIETSQPREKLVLSAGYKWKWVDITVRSTYFGEVTAWEKPTTGSFRNHRSQTFAGKNLFDVIVGVDISKHFNISIGANNITNVYPDKNRSDYAAYSSGQVTYTRNANQFGFNGSFYYANLTVKF
jgi:iron complex outermembrane recepter protein